MQTALADHRHRRPALVSTRLLIVAATLACAPAGNLVRAETAAPPAPVYTAVPAGPDGIGKRYMGRDIAGVMGWQAASWLERTERPQEERTDLLLQALELKPGMVVADIGAGSGYLSRRMAAAVLPGGRVLAEDVQPEMVALLRRAAGDAGLANLVPLLGSERDVQLPAATVDLAVMVDVYHELAFPREVLDSVVRALKVGGLLVFVEYRANDARVPIKPLHTMAVAQIRREAEVLPLQWVSTVETLPMQHVVVFRRVR